MALGNANTAAQARGKNQAVKIKKYKERNPDAFSLTASRLEGSPACPIRNDQLTNTIYHNGSNNLPAVNDFAYTSLPLASSNLSSGGFYKIVVSGAYYSINTDNSGVIRRVDAC
tara:strand:- start:468 stop:809 length:342 start_codon:yes stop_codon:yes gene_type:complete